MTNARFNPYHEWLGLEPNVLQPDYFQLIGIDPSEDQQEVIVTAADRALSRVRSFLPGQHATQWATLLDEITAAKKCLSDPAAREAYRKSPRQRTPVEAPSILETMSLAGPGPVSVGPANVGVPPSQTFGGGFPAATPAVPIMPTPALPPAGTPIPPSPGTLAPAAVASAQEALGTPGTGTGGTGNVAPVAVNPPVTSAVAPSVPTPGTPPATTNSAWSSVPPWTPGGSWQPAASPTPAWGSPWSAGAPAVDPMAPANPQPASGALATPPAPVWPSAPTHGSPAPANSYTTPWGAPAGSPAPQGAMSPPYAPHAPAHSAQAPLMAPMAVPVAGIATLAQQPLAAPGQAYGAYAAYGSQAPVATAPLASPVTPNGFAAMSAVPAPSALNGPGSIAAPMTAGQLTAGQLLVPDPPEPGGGLPMTRPPSVTRAVSNLQQARGTQMPLMLALGAVMVVVMLVLLVVAMNSDPTGQDNPTQVAANTTSNSPAMSSSTRDVPPGGNRATRDRPTPTRSTPKPRKTTVAIENDGEDDQAPGMSGDTEVKRPTRENPPSRMPSDPSDSMTEPLTETKPEKTPGKPTADPTPTETPDPKPTDPPATDPPAPPTKPETKPDSKPDSSAKPSSVPTPEMKPESSPTVLPSKQEIAALSKLLSTARTAISEQQYEVAAEELAKAESLAKLPAHMQRVDRLKQLNHYTQEFRRALREAVSNLKGGQPITVKSTVVGVVETFPNEDRIILRVAGMNRTYTFDGLPIGLAVAIADLWLDQKEASSLLVKASYVLAHKSATDEMRTKARGWLNEAQSSLPEMVANLAPVFDERDDDLQKDVDALNKTN